MQKRRQEKLNSLLKEVISDVIFKKVRNPNISELLTVTKVEITQDMHEAKVFISIMDNDEAIKKSSIDALNSAAGFIAVNSAAQTSLRYFPKLTFKLDRSLEQFEKIEKILKEIKND
ncbi:MAG TPA: 30S ribosome-binding factor RbfA [Chlamydiales bacterium]|nr:30S ribosome-binding factor RbfA [Chlamydiales bacterium]